MITKISLGLILALSFAVTFLYWRNERLASDNAELVVAHEALNAIVRDMRKNIANINSSVNILYVDMKEARKETADVRELLSKHNMRKIALAKPALLSRAMQRGTAKIFKELEDAANNTK